MASPVTNVTGILPTKSGGKIMASSNQSGKGSSQGSSSGSKQSDTSKRGFASMDPAQQREIASEGGRAAHEKGTAHEFTSEEARRAGAMSHKNDAGSSQSSSSTGSSRSGSGSGNQGSARDRDQEDEDQRGSSGSRSGGSGGSGGSGSSKT
jgi:hypothetical protein